MQRVTGMGRREDEGWRRADQKGEERFSKRKRTPLQVFVHTYVCHHLYLSASLIVTRLMAVRTPHSASTAAVLGSARCL